MQEDVPSRGMNAEPSQMSLGYARHDRPAPLYGPPEADLLDFVGRYELLPPLHPSAVGALTRDSIYTQTSDPMRAGRGLVGTFTIWPHIWPCRRQFGFKSAECIRECIHRTKSLRA